MNFVVLLDKIIFMACSFILKKVLKVELNYSVILKDFMKALFGLPKKVLFCKKSLISNQESSSINLNILLNQKKTLNIDKNGLSDTWKYSRQKLKLILKIEKKIINCNRGKYGEFDCIVPGNDGKIVVMLLIFLNLNMG